MGKYNDILGRVDFLGQKMGVLSTTVPRLFGVRDHDQQINVAVGVPILAGDGAEKPDRLRVHFFRENACGALSEDRHVVSPGELGGDVGGHD